MVSPLACDHGVLALLLELTDPFDESLIGDKFTCEFIIPLSVLRAFCGESVTKDLTSYGFALAPPLGLLSKLSVSPG